MSVDAVRQAKTILVVVVTVVVVVVVNNGSLHFATGQTPLEQHLPEKPRQH